MSINPITIYPRKQAWRIIENALGDDQAKFCPFRIHFRECIANMPFELLNAEVYTAG